MSHAILSPSSAARWINCPPSARINAEAPRTDTVYTLEGTLAHEVCELKARKYFTPMSPRKFTAEMNKLKQNELWQPEMDDCSDRYLDVLKGIASGFGEKPHVALEQQFDLSEVAPGAFGTADCLMVCGDTLHVIDFKYGRGVAVEVRENPQLMLYALGALMDYAAIYEISAVRMTIVQPRIKSEPETWEIDAQQLRQWAEDIVKPAALLAIDGQGEYAEGEWCRFCAIRGSCRARAAASLALDDFSTHAPATLSDQEIGRALTVGRRLREWLSDLEEYALGACLDGREIPGFKVVEGRSVRAWIDQDKAFEAARSAGVPDEMLYERKPVTLAALEKIMGRKAFSEVMSDYITTPPGKPALALSDDKRSAITRRTTAEDDFKEDMQ